MSTPDECAVVSLPATSRTVAWAVRPAPSPVIVLSPGALPSRPDRPSDAVQWTVTSPAYQPLPFGAVVGAPARDGAVVSRFTVTVETEDALSALSVAEPLTVWPAPSLDRVVGAVHVLTRESASAQANETVTGVWCQPAALAAVSGAPGALGAVLSSFTV